MKVVSKIDNHDTRGRKIVTINYAKKALIMTYAIFFMLCLILRELMVESYITVIENHLSSAVRFGIIDWILFFIAWIFTFKFGMNKFAIRNIEKSVIKAIFVLINISVCVFFVLMILFKTYGFVNTLEHQYKSVINTYSSYIDDETENKLTQKLEETLNPFKEILFSMACIEITLGICGNLLGCAFIKRDVENLGIDDEEYKVCKNIDLKNSNYIV